MEKEDENFRKKCLQAHGYKFSDHESDIDKSESDEDLRAMKPPPIPYQELKNRIVKIDNTKKNSSLGDEIYVNGNTQSCNNLKEKRCKDLARNKTEVEEEKMPSTQVYSKTANRNGSNSIDKNNVMSLKESSTLKVSPILPRVDIQSNNNLMLDGALTSFIANLSRISANNTENKEKTQNLSNMDNNRKYNSTTRAVPASYISEASATRTCDTRHTTPKLQVNNVGERSCIKAPVTQEISSINNRANYDSAMQHATRAYPISYIDKGSTASSCDRPRTPRTDNQVGSTIQRAAQGFPVSFIGEGSATGTCHTRHTTPKLQVNNVGERSCIKAPVTQEISSINNRANYDSAMQHATRAYPISYIDKGSTTSSRDRPRTPRINNQANYNSIIHDTTCTTSQVNSVDERNATSAKDKQKISNINNKANYSSTMQRKTQTLPINYIGEESTTSSWGTSRTPRMDNQVGSTIQRATQGFPISYIDEGSTASSWNRSNIYNMNNHARTLETNNIAIIESTSGEIDQQRTNDTEPILNEEDADSSECCCIII